MSDENKGSDSVQAETIQSEVNAYVALSSALDLDLLLLLAIRWRREQLKKDTVGEETYALAMGRAIDEMVHNLAQKVRGK